MKDIVAVVSNMGVIGGSGNREVSLMVLWPKFRNVVIPGLVPGLPCVCRCSQRDGNGIWSVREQRGVQRQRPRGRVGKPG